MKNKKIIIAGGTGFIGQAITQYFGKDNTIIILTRELKNVKTNALGNKILDEKEFPRVSYIRWDGATLDNWADEMNNTDILVNLTGKTVNCRYTKKNKKEIFDSRTKSTRVLGLAIQQSVTPPKLWINAASATIYPHATTEPRDENFTGFANDFSVQVCKSWEKAFFDTRTAFTRKVALRMAITLGQGGVMTPYFNLLKYGLGGKQGSGDQMYSWVHVTDTCRMIEWIFDHSEMEGIYNCVSPNPVTNQKFMEALRKATGTRIGLPAFKWMLSMGAWLIGTETELILKSRWVLPARILESGFSFTYPTIEPAFEDIIKQTSRKKYHLF
jgi:uncharacterized protein (TIGR01777 family)